MGPSASRCETDRSRSLSRVSGTYISPPFLDVWETDREMCGIIGVAGVSDASRVTYLGLYSLQHRGQESAGMVTVDGAGVARSHRGMGLVSDVFSETVLAGLPDDQLLDALERVEGGYSLVVTIGRTLYAIVDPRGFRPLWLGKLGSGYVVVSETCALDLIGATAVRELEPGEFLRIQGSPPEIDRLPALPSKPHQRCIFELVYFSRPARTIFGRSVDRVPRARADDPTGRCERSPFPRRLRADHRSLLLRNRHADQVRVNRLEPFPRGDSPAPGCRDAGVSVARRDEARGRRRHDRVLPCLFLGRISHRNPG